MADEKKFLDDIRKGDVGAVAAALKADPDLINYKSDVLQNSVMHIAAAAGHEEMINYLLDVKPELLEERNREGKMPKDMVKTAESQKDQSGASVPTPEQADVTTGVQPPAEPAPEDDTDKSKDKGFDWQGILANPMVLGLGAGLIGMFLGGGGMMGLLIGGVMALATGLLAPPYVRDFLEIPQPDQVQVTDAEEKLLDGVGVSKEVDAPATAAAHGAEKATDKVAKADDNQTEMKSFGDGDANLTLGEMKEKLASLNYTDEQVLNLAKRIGDAAVKDGVTYTPAQGTLSDETVVLTLDTEKGTDVKLQIDKKLQVANVPTGESVTPSSPNASQGATEKGPAPTGP